MRALTVALFFLSFSALAQNNSINVYPWNPDSDNDNQIGVEDLQSFLTVYGNSFGLPPEPCTYDGTELEELISGFINETIILDSLFFEYELEDISTYYIAGCPQPITQELVFVNSAMLHNSANSSSYFFIGGDDIYGEYSQIRFWFDADDGNYEVTFRSDALTSLGFVNDGFFSSSMAGTGQVNIPFPSSWFMNENGIELYWAWGWTTYANYLHILPYWHYADE
jgi:hypothetical protein